MAARTVGMKIVVTNEKSFRAIRVAAETIIDLMDDLPWRERELTRALNALTYAIKHLEVVPCPEDDT